MMALVSICFEWLSMGHILHLKETWREIKPHKTYTLSKRPSKSKGKRKINIGYDLGTSFLDYDVFGSRFHSSGFLDPLRSLVNKNKEVFSEAFCEEILEEINHWISRTGKDLQQKATFNCKLAANQAFLVSVAWLANLFASLRDTHHRSQNHFSDRSTKNVHFFCRILRIK